MYLISTHRSHVYQYAYYPAGKKNTQLITSLHHETNETMSEHGERLEHYYGNTLEDQDDNELPDTTSVDEMKQNERGILHAERKVDAQIGELGGTALRRTTPYERKSRALAVRIFVEEEDIEDDDMNDEDKKADNCLDVLLRDIDQIKEEFEKDMEVMERMKTLCSNLTSVVASGASIANNQNECMQDTAAMERMMSLRRNVKDYELGLRKRLFSDIHEARKRLCDDDDQSDDNE